MSDELTADEQFSQEYYEIKNKMNALYHTDTKAVVDLIKSKYEPVMSEPDATVMHPTEYLKKMFELNGKRCFSTLLEEMLIKEGFKQELVTRRGQMNLCWLFKEK